MTSDFLIATFLRSNPHMLIRYWFKTNPGLGYGVTAASEEEARALLNELGYPRSSEVIIEIQSGVVFTSLDQNHVVPNAGPMGVRGVWFPMHNLVKSGR